MTSAPINSTLSRLSRAAAICLLFVLVLPVCAALALALPLTSVFALIGSTLLIEYGAAPVGIALGLPPAYVFFALTSIALGIVLALFGIFDTLGEHSERVKQFLKTAKLRADSSRILSHYGIYGLVPVVLVFGFYFCPPIAWVLGWDRKRSIALILAGYCIASAALILAAAGILAIIFPQVNSP
ncbi:MAG: small multi-drug export protein [Methanoregula sp.]